MYSRQFATSLWDRMISFLAERAFVTVRAGAAVRKWSLIILGGLFWIVTAFLNHPLNLGAEPLRNVIEYPFRALFAADVFKHVLIAALVFWIAYRVAAIYLDDIFELKDVPLAARFISQTAFASRYNLIEIKEAKVAKEYQESPIYRIGGPGKVRVYLENAALFEKIDGTPRVIPPTVRRGGKGNIITDSAVELEGFERFREAIDLRDQVVDLSVYGRSRDGILVQAENVRLVFSVEREGERPSLERPYPFKEEAVEKLVYDTPPQPWTETMKGLIRRELGNFISRHTLSEFLAAIHASEVQDQIDEQIALQEEANQLAGTEVDGSLVGADPPLEAPSYVPRPEVSNLFYEFESEFSKLARKRGVQLRWIGVGTWVTPEEIIPTRHQSAWRITRENITRGSEEALSQLRAESRLGELSALVREVPIGKFRELNEDERQPKALMRDLTQAFRLKLKAALDLYERDGEQDSDAAKRLRCVLENMSRPGYHWVGKSDGS